jgi:hypothetical protein
MTQSELPQPTPLSLHQTAVLGRGFLSHNEDFLFLRRNLKVTHPDDPQRFQSPTDVLLPLHLDCPSPTRQQS